MPLTQSQTLAVAFVQNQRDEVRTMDVAGALPAEPGVKQQTYIAFSAKDHGADAGGLSPTLRAGGHTSSHANAGVMPAVAFDGPSSGVRRLTPRECERLQGFPDDYTLIPYGKRGRPAKDGPRYKALGNSIAVPCMRWLGQRIELVQKLLEAACPPTYSAGPPDKLLEETV